MHHKTKDQRAKEASVAALRASSEVIKHPNLESISMNQLADAEEKIQGKVVYPWSPGYNDDRKDFDDVYPALPIMIVYAVNITDLRTVINIAREWNRPMVLRSGGHSLAGFSVCDGIILDLSAMNNVYVNTNAKTAIIEAGATFGKIYPIVESYGLHMPGGGCPTVAVAGFMQGGGYSLTSRNFGMNCDTVIEITMMLADGKIVVANRNQNYELFWAVRGGTGNNFGILLNITYQLFPLGNIAGIQLLWNVDDNIDNAALALHTIQEKYLKGNQFPNMGIETILTTDAKDNKKKIFFCAAWIGNPIDFKAALTPLLSISGCTINIDEIGKYSKVNADLLDNCPVLTDDVKAYSRSTYIERPLDINDWKNILNYFRNTAPNQYTMVDMEGYGGKINTIPENDCAFMHRNTLCDFYIDAFFNKETNDQKKNEDWIEAFYTFMQQYANGRSYQNYPNRKQTDFANAFWGKYYGQLMNIKSFYDPTNFFNFQQSIGAHFTAPTGNQVELFPTIKTIYYETY
jgi:FAD/FMN-containing dehydrogenase